MLWRWKGLYRGKRSCFFYYNKSCWKEVTVLCFEHIAELWIAFATVTSKKTYLHERRGKKASVKSSLPSPFIHADLTVEFPLCCTASRLSCFCPTSSQNFFNSDGVLHALKEEYPVSVCVRQNLTQKGSPYLPFSLTVTPAFSFTFHVNFIFAPVYWKQFFGPCSLNNDLWFQPTSKKNQFLFGVRTNNF